MGRRVASPRQPKSNFPTNLLGNMGHVYSTSMESLVALSPDARVCALVNFTHQVGAPIPVRGDFPLDSQSGLEGSRVLLSGVN